jgi:hypothetical protein
MPVSLLGLVYLRLTAPGSGTSPALTWPANLFGSPGSPALNKRRQYIFCTGFAGKVFLVADSGDY